MSPSRKMISDSLPFGALITLISSPAFNQISLLNDLAGNKTNEGWDAIDAQVKLIESEWKELKDGITARDIHELRDGIADMRVTILGLAHRAGVDADEDLDEVVFSNLTKFDSTIEDAMKTREKYLAMGVETIAVERPSPFHQPSENVKLYVTKSAFDQTGQDSKKYPKGKWLKSHRFCEPEFAPLPDAVFAKLMPEVVETTDQG